MRSAYRWSICLVLLAGSVQAAEPSGKIVEEVWNAAYLEGGKAGYVRTTVEEIEAGPPKVLHTTTELNLTVKRFNDLVQLRMETGTDETEDGKVLGVFMRQHLGKQQALEVTGTVRDKALIYQIKGAQNGTQPAIEKRIPWNDKVVGLRRQEHIFQEQKVKPGDSFTYLSYEPTIVAVVTTRVNVKDYESVEFLGAQKKLLRVEATTDKIHNVQLPMLVTWLNEDLVPVRSQVEIQGLGLLTLYRTTKQQVLAKGGAPAKATDIGVSQLLRLNRRIAHPYQTKSAVYRIILKGDDDPGSAFARDDRQDIRNLKGNTFELVVQAQGKESPVAPAKEAPLEFLTSCYFINSTDARVRGFTHQAVGQEKDPWNKAVRIERWVHQHMAKKNFTEAFATADQVARTLEGDCTEHAMLTAAMCRAADVPSRTAVGLIYVDLAHGPVLGFHMWTEVWIKGEWRALDATLGQGYVGATHIKITDHSWHDTQSLTPLLPVVRVLGKISVAVVSIDGVE